MEQLEDSEPKHGKDVLMLPIPSPTVGRLRRRRTATPGGNSRHGKQLEADCSPQPIVGMSGGLPPIAAKSSQKSGSKRSHSKRRAIHQDHEPLDVSPSAQLHDSRLLKWLRDNDLEQL